MAYPTALLMGMTPEQYWYGNPWDFSAYREAERLRRERDDWDRWEAGMYVWAALCKTAPLMNPFAESHQADEWFDRPLGSDATAREGDGVYDREAESVEHQRVIGEILARTGR
jgi:hypothetical protein